MKPLIPVKKEIPKYDFEKETPKPIKKPFKLWNQVLKKLALKHLKIEKKKVKLPDAGSGKYKTVVINDIIVIYEGHLYYKTSGRILLGTLIPQQDMFAFIYFLFRQAKIEQIDIYDSEQEMKIFGLLITISSSLSPVYYKALPEKLTDEENKIMTKLLRR
jgi:hypothetical protein